VIEKPGEIKIALVTNPELCERFRFEYSKVEGEKKYEIKGEVSYHDSRSSGTTHDDELTSAGPRLERFVGKSWFWWPRLERWILEWWQSCAG
jgi:hypothetical protein